MSSPTVQSLFDLSNRRALITGASGYLGHAFAEALADAGATVVVSSRIKEKAQEAAAALPSPNGATHYGVQLDHTESDSVQEGFQRALECAGGLDILVNNGNQGCGDDLTTVSAEGFQQHLRNVTGYFELARHLQQHVVERRSPGVVVMIGSMYGVVGSYPHAYEGVCAASPVAYHASKGGIVHMTRHLAVYWAKDRVRVNCLSPGAFPNPKTVPDGLVPRLVKKCPLGRMGVPYELKGALVFLASDASSYMTGQNLIVDGGWTAW